jgi:hypothetical protein
MRRTAGLLFSSFLLTLFFGLGLDIPVLAQSSSTTGSITGVVTDEQGATVGGVAITAKNVDTNLTRETTSNEDGSFLIPQLPPGSYDLTVQAEGFTTKSSRLELVLGTTALFNFSMQLGTTSEVIEVRGTYAIDESKTESSTNIARERIDNLPINRRNFLDFSLITPRVVKDRVPGQGAAATSGLSFNGQPARFNNITIDGLDNNETATGAVRATFSQDAVQEFQVVSDSYSAEFGRTIGGVVNIVTKVGTNEFHGNLFALNRNDEISARDTFAPFKPPYSQYQFGTALSGPIKRDRLFFFTSFERLSIKQNNIVTISNDIVSAAQRQGLVLRNGPVPFSIGTTSLLARGDAKLTENDTLWVRYNGGFNYDGAIEPFGGLRGETNGGVQRLKDNSLAFSNTYINAGLNLVNETRFLYGRRDQDILQLDDGPRIQILAPEGSVVFGRAGLLPQPRQESFYQVVNNVSLTRGRNQIKFGADLSYAHPDSKKTKVPIFAGGSVFFVPLDFTALTGIPSLPFFSALQAFDPAKRTPQQRSFLVALSSLLPISFPDFPRGLNLADMALPLAYAQGFGDPAVSLSQKQFSLFVQNEIKVSPSLLVKAGLRYDINRTLFVPDNNGNFSPRIALSYHPDWLKLNLHTAYGIFFGAPLFGTASIVQLTSVKEAIKIPVITFPFSILPFALPGHKFPDGDRIPPGVNFVPQLSTVFSFDPNLRNSYTQQITAGLDYLIGNNTQISVTYDHVRGVKVFSGRDINPVVNPVPGSALESQLTGRRIPDRGSIFEFESAFDSYYDGVTFAINQRFDWFTLLAHYTFSKAIDNYIDIVAAAQETVDPFNLAQERGLSLQDVRSRFVLSGIFQPGHTKNWLLRGFQLSTIINLESGRPYNLLAGVDLNMNGDNPPGDRPAGLGRNVGITPGFANIDLRLMRSLALQERLRLQLIAEVFNLFNRVNINEVDAIFPPDAQGQFHLPPKSGSRFIATPDRFRSAFAPRQFQLGFKLIF